MNACIESLYSLSQHCNGPLHVTHADDCLQAAIAAAANRTAVAIEGFAGDPQL